MMKIALGAGLAMLVTTYSFADMGNSERAGAMAEALSGEPGIGRAASSVSGNNPDIGAGRSASGWGNTGSAALAGGSITEGAKSQGRGGGSGGERGGSER